MKYSPSQYAKTLAELVAAHPRERKETIRQFARTLAAHNVLSLLPDIMREFSELKLQAKRRTRVSVLLPQGASAARIKSGLRARSEVAVHAAARLRGGVVIEREGVRVDNSIAMRLKRLRQALTE